MTDRLVMKDLEHNQGIGHQTKLLPLCVLLGRVLVMKYIHQKAQVQLSNISSYCPGTDHVTPPGSELVGPRVYAEFTLCQ